MCSRNVLKEQMQRAREKGYRFNLGVETEIYVVRKENGRPVPANPRDRLAKAAYDVHSLLDYFPWVEEMVRYMNQLGWGVFSFDHEDSNSQFEFDWAYNDCLVTSDRFTLFRLMAKAVAQKYDAFATFMAKPYGDRTGNGAHFNMSLADVETGENLFNDAGHAYNLSQIGHWFMGGILKHAEALCAVWAPTVNSYKRLVKSGSRTGYTWAPVYRTFGRNNRTNMLRVPLMGGRVECRAADSSCNPYLASALALAAGLEGIEQKIDPGPNYEINLYDLSDQELRERGIRLLPRTLLEAAECFEGDALAKEVFGEDLHRAFCDIKYAEWWDYHNHVSDWEIEEYLTKF
jgi:glutamine synthetase